METKHCSVEGCANQYFSRDLCWTHYYKAKAAGTLPPRPPPLTTPERFWSKVRKAAGDGCWEWTAHITSAGYGQFWFSPGHGVVAHRVAWQFVNGEIPEGVKVCHRCDNPRCVRAEPGGSGHLFLGTQKDNMQDASRKGRMRAYTFRGRYAELRARYAGGEKIADIAASAGVRYTAVWRIVTTDIPDPYRPPRLLPGPRRGERNPNSKLTETAVRDMRASHAAGMSLSALGRRWGVCAAVVSRIVQRRSWAHVA